MKLYAKIITDDKRFERMLFLELSSYGIEIISDIDNCDELTFDNFFTVVDLDFCQESDVLELCRYSKVIGISYSYENEVENIADECYAFLHRPFLITEFVSLILHEESKIRHEKATQKRMKNLNPDKTKTSNLAIDHNEKCVFVGNNRIVLCDNEFKIMSALFDNIGKIVSREELSFLIGASESNMCEVYICMLRRKLDNRFGVKIIYTVRGKGYMIK